MDRAWSRIWRGWRVHPAGAALFAAGLVLFGSLSLQWTDWLHTLRTGLAAAIVVLSAQCVVSTRNSRAARRGEHVPAPSPADATSLRPLADAVNRLRPLADTALGFAELLASRNRDIPAGRWREETETLLEHCQEVSHHLRILGTALHLHYGDLKLADQHVDAADLFEVALKHCSSDAERWNVTVTAGLIEGIELHCDPTRLRQAIKALVRFAMAAAGGGSLCIALKRQTDDGLAFSLHWPAAASTPDDPALTLGSGIDPQVPDGIGPAVARRIALLHGGEVSLASGRDGGTELRLTLPASRVTWPKGSLRPGVLAA